MKQVIAIIPLKQLIALMFSFIMIFSTHIACAMEKTTSNYIEDDSIEKGDYVVILHGIARSSNHMEKMEKYLLKQGYDAINIDYPSTDYTLESLIYLVHQDISKKLTEDKTVHFVGYSMGGILNRAIINKHRPKNLGRVVQLAPPNNGSEVSDFLKENWLYKKVYGPAGQQLTTNQQKIKELFGDIYYDLGIIAGNRTIDPISSSIIPGKDDGRVSIENTKLKGMKDHIVVSVAHPFLPSNKTVQQQTAYFLQNGVFKKDE